ncbi:MAG TPA: MgtC/SapB family protein [Anaerolineae bacterium]|nr:MgtC/SapB family protein [Anaerolineae bacterium]
MAGLVATYRLELSVPARVAVAMLLGAAIGLERETKDKPAGLRTHMLMAGAASVMVAFGPVMVERLGETISGDVLRADPIRLIVAVSTGVSFLGAGTILRRGSERQVERLTTAASLLLPGAAGMSRALEL